MRKRAGETSRVFSWAVGGGESAGSRTGAAGARSEEGARREERWVAKNRARGEGRGGGIALLRAPWGENERRLACIFGELSSRCGTLRGSGAARGSRWGKTGNAVQAMSGRTSAPGNAEAAAPGVHAALQGRAQRRTRGRLVALVNAAFGLPLSAGETRQAADRPGRKRIPGHAVSLILRPPPVFRVIRGGGRSVLGVSSPFIAPATAPAPPRRASPPLFRFS